jgi:hypothetical protein
MGRMLPEMEWPRLKAPFDIPHRKSPDVAAEEIFFHDVLKEESRPARASPLQRSPDDGRGDESVLAKELAHKLRWYRGRLDSPFVLN